MQPSRCSGNTPNSEVMDSVYSVDCVEGLRTGELENIYNAVYVVAVNALIATKWVNEQKEYCNGQLIETTSTQVEQFILRSVLQQEQTAENSKLAKKWT